MALVENFENVVADEEVEEQSEHNHENGVSVIAADSLLNRDHPLKCPWGFWFLSSQKNQDWMDRLSNICTLTTAEEFWALIDRIRPPSVMLMCDYSLFRGDIQPVWEVPENKDGGRLVCVLAKHELEVLNEIWLKLMLGLIGNYFEELTPYICGAVCSIRQKGSKISLWTSSTNDEGTNKKIGIALRNLWLHHFPQFFQQRPIFFEAHADAQSKQSSVAPHKFIV